MGTRGGSLIAMTAAACSACTLLVGTSDLAGGDGGTPAPVGQDAQPDVLGDVATGDASVDGLAPVSCSDPSVVLCENFDAVGAIEKYNKIVDDSTTVDRDETRSVSAPASALFTIHPSNNGSPDATLTFRTSEALKDFAVQGKIFIARSEPGQLARLLHVQSIAQNGDTFEPILVNHNGDVKNGAAVTNVGASAPAGRWFSISLEIRAGVPPAKVILELDGLRKDVAVPSGWTPGFVSARLGISEANSPTTGWLVHWDDVVIRKL